MKLFQLLGLLDPEIKPEHCKIHLATWNGWDDPLEVFLEGRFEEWQSFQGARNFERPMVVSLIAMRRGATNWLFAGVFDQAGRRDTRGSEPAKYHYSLKRRALSAELIGRLMVSFKRSGRQSYLRAEQWTDSLEVSELRAERLTVSEFPGYLNVRISKAELDAIVRTDERTWRGALSSVAGVYVIADRRTGKLYIGSATGYGGLWGRWKAYSASGHDNNRELRALLKTKKAGYAEENFQFGILEIADPSSSEENMIEREARWKELLLTRQPFGYNAN